MILFPYSHEEAYYDPLGIYINFSNYENKKFKTIISQGINQYTLDDYKIFLHEYRHYIDHISTNYGQEYLIHICDIFNSIVSNNPYSLTSLSPLYLPELICQHGLNKLYVRESLKTDNLNNLWQIKITFKVIENIPISTIIFLKPDGNLVCETPVTYVSLFECNAVFEEMHLLHEFIQQFHFNSDDKTRYEFLEFYKYFVNTFNSELIEYSVATHIVSSLLQIPHVFSAYGISSLICTLLLNLTKDHLEIIATYDRLCLTKNLHYHLIINRDFGYILYYLCFAYKERFTELNKFDINDFLDFFDLPDIITIDKDVKREMNLRIIKMDISNRFYNKFNTQLQSGLEVFDLRGSFGGKIALLDLWTQHDFSVNAIFGDDYWEGTLNVDSTLLRPIESLHPMEWYDLVNYLKNKNSLIAKIGI